jgi:D-alanyl-D-alanine carboxypeptidase/D-alanyl-D-alanine-endopeptidase (penicillin-binding protein 4)
MHHVSFALAGFLLAWTGGSDLQILRSSNLNTWIDQVTWAQPFQPVVLQPRPETDAIAQAYLAALTSLGFGEQPQGIWLQLDDTVLVDHQGTIPLPAASLTKIATTLVALDEWGPDHTFTTLLATTGSIDNGILQGNLIVQGGGDPFFVWEEAIALGNALTAAGITQVTGDLIVVGDFVMNYETDPLTAGRLFIEALNASQWGFEAENQYLRLPDGTPRPQVAIAGTIQPAAQMPAAATPLLQRESLPLAQILKAMNIYSNNVMAEVMAEALGGSTVLATRSAAIAGVPVEEIQLINGSGLGEENQVSPRASVAMLIAIQRAMQPNRLSVSDLFPVSGRDGGTLLDRNIPTLAAVKTGTLSQVSALAGAFPTRQGVVWFSLINRGWDLDNFRRQQDVLLQQVVTALNPAAIAPRDMRPDNTQNPEDLLGAPERTQRLTAARPADTQVSTAAPPPSDTLQF